MGLLERIIRALIYIACVVLAFYLILWVLGALGIAIPAMVVKVIGVILALVCILMLVRLFAGSTWPTGPNGRWWP